MNRTPIAAPADEPYEPTVTFILITPKMAEEWLGKNIGNRNVRDARVRLFAADIAAGKWAQTAEAIKFDWNGRLIDGQHRLNAVLLAGKPARMLVARGLDPDAQKVLDTGSKRTSADALRMHGSTANYAIISAAIKLIVGIENGTVTSTNSRVPELTNTQILDYYNGREEALESAATFGRRIAKSTLAMASVATAFAYQALDLDADVAIDFLTDLEQMRTAGDGDPRYTLIRRLQRARETGERSSQAQQYFFFIRAWNAARKGERLSRLMDTTRTGALTIPRAS